MNYRPVCFIMMVCFSLTAGNIFADVQKKRVAVLEIEAKNAPAAYADITRDMVELNLHKSGAYQVLERNQMKLVLKEQGFSLSGCTDTSCAVEIGKVLSTEIVVVGSLNKIKNYAILLKFIDVTKGEIIIADSESAETEDGIEDAVSRVVNRIVEKTTNRRIEEPVKQNEPEKKEPAFTLPKVELPDITILTGNAPSGITAAYTYYKPFDSVFKDVISSLMGGSAGYIYAYNNFFSFAGNIEYLQRSKTEGKVMFNSYSAGARAGVPVFDVVYPYAGVACRVTWVRENNDEKSANFTGYGGDAFAGISIMFMDLVGIYGQYNYSWARLNDEDGSDISGMYISAGIIYKI